MTNAKWTNLKALAEYEGQVWVVGYPAHHSNFIEYGTRPHAPPFKPIFGWCKRKLGLGDKEAAKAAWAIINTMKAKGTDAKPFLRPAVEKALGRKFKSLEDAAEFVFNESQDNILKKGITDRGTLLQSGYYEQIQ